MQWLAYELADAKSSSDREQVALWIPALLRALNLQPLDGRTAAAFRSELQKTLTQKNGAGGSRPWPFNYERSSHRIRVERA